MKKSLEVMNFELEGLDGKSYEGYSAGEFWNGWECPYFTLDVALQLMKDLNEDNQKNSFEINTLVFDDKAQAFIYQNEDYPENQWERFEKVQLEGKTLYAVGSYSWCWWPEEKMDLADMNEMDAKHPNWSASSVTKMKIR